MKSFIQIPLLLIGISAYSTTIDSTIFTNKKERHIITNFVDSNHFDALDLLLSFDYSIIKEEKIKKQFNDIIADLDNKNIATKNKKKNSLIICCPIR